MKTILTPVVAGLAGIFFATFIARADVDPRTNSWFTTYSSQYARIYTNNTMKAAGTPLTMWSNGSQTQTNPAYCGVQEVYSSTNWVYVRSSGLAGYNMGPWMNGNFPNLPTNQKLLYALPRTNSVPTTKTANGGGQIGIFVDGVEMFNSWDAYTWSTVSNVDAQNITGYWNRDAYVNEGVSFDPGYAHQQNGGTYHYHADPIALRYLLGDHVDYISATKTYSESTNAPTKHSPILGWVADGFPIYGPYGYSNATNVGSGIRRMVSGYILGNAQTGGRKYLPQWAARLFALTGSNTNQTGAPYTGIHTNGCYMEDNDYLGDHGYVQGVTNADGTFFDLNEYNLRWCVTPEFTNGTYAYFVAINSNGVPVFPYNIGRGFFGSPLGNSVGGISENVITNFVGGPNTILLLNSPAAKNGSVILTWSAAEGGTYMVQSTTNLSMWTTNSTSVAAVLNAASYTNNPADNYRFYRTALTSLATYDSAGSGGYTPTFYSFSPGGNGSRGSSVTVTNSLSLTFPSPPLNAPLPTATLAGISGSNISHPATNIVVCTFAIPTNAPTGLTNIIITFGAGTMPPPWTNSFTIN